MDFWTEIEKEQKILCKRLNTEWIPVNRHLLLAINSSIFDSIEPLNGIRYKAEGTINGWFIWAAGEIPQNQNDFFESIHTEHLYENDLTTCILKYLGLPPGSRFQIDRKGYEDVWFDSEILKN